MYQVLADTVLLLHLAVVVFVVGGLVSIVVGNLTGHPWVNALWFRLLHLGAIAVVVLQAWSGQICPLTTLESWLRLQAGTAGYGRGFIEHWVGRILFYEAPAWVFGVAYTVFGLLVAAAWWHFPPRMPWRDPSAHGVPDSAQARGEVDTSTPASDASASGNRQGSVSKGRGEA